jgi:hypothetical protein
MAALSSHGAGPNDPRILECREALAYHKIRRVVEAERQSLSASGAALIVESLREVAQ